MHNLISVHQMENSADLYIVLVYQVIYLVLFCYYLDS
jgi:hypothetical protein